MLPAKGLQTSSLLLALTTTSPIVHADMFGVFAFTPGGGVQGNTPNIPGVHN